MPDETPTPWKSSVNRLVAAALVQATRAPNIESDVKYRYRRAAHAAVPPRTMIKQTRILNMGSCGIHNPQFSLNTKGIIPYIWTAMGFTSTPYALSSGAAIQLYDFCVGERYLSDDVRRLSYDGINLPSSANRHEIDDCEITLVELSTPIEPLFEGAIVNINWVSFYVIAELKRRGVDEKLVAHWASALMDQREEARAEHGAAILKKLPKKQDMVRRAVSELRTRRIDVDQMVRDLSALRERVAKPMAFVHYDFRYMPDGRAIDWPAGFKKEQREVARLMDLPTLDFAPTVAQLGVDQVIMPDMSHWKAECYPIQAEMIYDFVATIVGRPSLAEVEHVAAEQARNAPETFENDRPEYFTNLTERINAGLNAVHAPRLAALGVNESGLGAHYERLLQQGQIYGAREQMIAAFLLDRLPQFDRYVIMQAGLGQLALALAMSGKNVRVHDVHLSRFTATTASVEGFEQQKLIACRTVTPRPGLPGPTAVSGKTIAIALETDLHFDLAQEDEALDRLSTFDALLIEPRVFLRMRNDESEREEILAKLEGLGFKMVNRIRTSNFVFLTREPVDAVKVSLP